MSSRSVIGALTVLLVLCGAALGVMLLRQARVEPVPQQPQAGAAASPLGHFIALDGKLPAPALAFRAREGAEKHLADFKGHLLLVNLWATWCAPCVEEMPALDRLQAKLGQRLAILAISQDRRGAAAVDPFLAKTGITHLAVFLDPKSSAIEAFGVQGLPTSFLISRDGMILAKLEGAAKWDEAPMLSRLETYIAAK
ncbi:MAG: TlpA family protein disulfide reductase [Stellaceae bacterium]